jgi:hypothetical protein
MDGRKYVLHDRRLLVSEGLSDMNVELTEEHEMREPSPTEF